MPSAYNERAMLAKAHLYSPALLAQHNIRPGDLILVRRVYTSWQSSTLLLVAEVDADSSDPLIGTRVAVISPSEVPQQLRTHLMRIHDADKVMRSHLVRQGLSAMAQRNGQTAPLSEHVNAMDRVFVRPAGGSIRKYLLNDRCPLQLCRQGACANRAQMYLSFPSLREGMRADALHLILSGAGPRNILCKNILCPACHGLNLVRRTERNRIATALIQQGARPRDPIIMEHLTDHLEMIRYFHQLELGHNLYNDPIYHEHPIEPSSVSSPSNSPVSSRPSSPQTRPTTRDPMPQSTSAAREPRTPQPTPRSNPARSATAPMHPNRRRTQEQLDSIRTQTRGTGHTLGTSQQSGRSGQTPAQRASHAARQRQRQSQGAVSAEARGSPANGATPVPSSRSTAALSERIRSRGSNVGQQATERVYPSRPRPSSNYRQPSAASSSRTTAARQPTIEELVRVPPDTSAAAGPSRASNNTAPASSSRTPSTRQPTIEELIRAPPDTPAAAGPSRTPATTAPVVGWEEVPRQLRQEWNALPTWMPIPPTLQQEWDEMQWPELPEWESFPQRIIDQMTQGNQTAAQASRSAISNMVKSSFRNWSERNVDKAKDDCVICLKAFGEGGDESLILTTTCGHNFHDECVMDWFKASDRCPLCRKKME